MKKKYTLTNETLVFNGHTLYRIRALIDIEGRVNKGELGGWIEKESNLSHKGLCWVSDNAQVYGNAQVYDNALVSDNAHVSDNAQVYGDARIYGDAQVYGDALVYGNAMVSGKALIGWVTINGIEVNFNWDEAIQEILAEKSLLPMLINLPNAGKLAKALLKRV